MEITNQNPSERYGISLESMLVPYLTGSTGLLFAPHYKRYFKENPIQPNPDHKQIPKLYWGGHPRSAMTLGVGAFLGSYILSNQITIGLEEAMARNDYTRLIAIGSSVAITNLASWAYEAIRKR